MKKLLVSFTIIIIIALTGLHAQNNIWSLPPNYYDNNGGQVNSLLAPGGTSPAPFSYPNYDISFLSNTSHNTMQDAQGNLLFSVVDGVIYDKEGFVIDNLPGQGNSETVIIPVPGNCNQYFIVINQFFYFSSNPNLFSCYPFFVTLDLSVPAPNNFITLRKGSLIDISTGIASPGDNGIDLSLNVNPSWPHSPYIKNVFMGATKLRVDNTRFLFISNGENVYRYLVTSNGIFYDNYSFLLDAASYSFNNGAFRSELEIHEFGTLGNITYRIATPYYSYFDDSRIKIVDLNNLGTLIGGSEKLIILEPDLFTLPPFIKGLEFSPNGEFLYFTHLPNSNAYPPNLTIPFKIFDINSNSFINNAAINTSLITDIPNFKYSMIELGKDDKLYLVNDNFMATISNADDPSNLGWNNTAVAVNYNLSSYKLVPVPPDPPKEEFKLFLLPDQIDGMDYTESFFANVACCIENSVYDVYESTTPSTFEFTGTQTWSYTGTNPWGVSNPLTAITVKDKMVIKTGANITINNMTFKFAPEAQLIIENGARLTINGTTLTVNTECATNLMWHGVEVWGNGANQGVTSGRFVANNSTIEHAIEATANYRHDLTSGSPAVNVMVTNSTGGIIQLKNNTIMHNNVFDVNMNKYQRIISGNLANDLSTFINCNFVTDNLLNDPLQTPLAHVRLSFVNGLLFSGCDFQNTATAGTFPYLLRGTGIQAEETKFVVTSGCTTPTFPCPIANIDKSHFNNLTRGVTAFSNNALKSVQIINSEFYDNWRGIFLRGLNVANVSNNIFDIGMSSGSISTSTVSYGLNLTHCDGYKVENNDFHTSFNGYLGCYVDNSMAGANEIYRNIFTDLIVASQAVNINGDGTSAGTGLVFRCNQYTETSDYDILISSGRIKAFHGSCATNQSPSNNQFSYTAQYGDFWMTNNTTPSGFNVSYQFSQPNGYNLEPRDYPNSATHYNNNNTFPSYCSSIFIPTTLPATSCPKQVAKTTSQLKAEIAALQLIINDLKIQIDGGNTNSLLNLIATTSGGNLKNALLAASPYLSDEVLIAYILSHPSNGNLKLVVLANSPLSSEVLAELENSSLPQGIANQINAAQTGISPRQELESEISYYEGEITKAKNDIIRILLFEENEDSTRRNFKDVADFLQEDEINNTTKENQLLVNAFMADENFTAAQQKINALATCGCVETINFCKLKNTIVQCQQYPEKEMVLTTNTTLQQTVNEVANASTSRQEITSAKVLLEEVGLTPVILEEIEIITPPSGLRLMNPTETGNGAATSTFVNLFPNPTSDQFTLTHNLVAENGEITLTIYDLMGRKLITKPVNDAETIISTTTLKAGVYFYSITQSASGRTGNQIVKTDKLMIE